MEMESWECQYHEEAVSAQNYGPIIVACTPELVVSFIRICWLKKLRPAGASQRRKGRWSRQYLS